MPMAHPAAGNITKSFGRQQNGSFHHGTDWGWGSGREVRNMLAGRVVAVQTLRDYGKIILMDHGRDINGTAVQTRYCHLAAQYVEVGQDVPIGSLIGLMGSTGDLSKAVHLHSELWLNGSRYDQQAYTFIPPAAPTPPPVESEEMYLVITAGWVSTTPSYIVHVGFIQNISSAQAPAWWFASGDTDVAKRKIMATQADFLTVLKMMGLGEFTIQQVLDIAGSNSSLIASWYGGGSGTFTASDRAMLDAIPSVSETTSLLTSTANIINAHTTAEVDGIPASSSVPLSITLTGTATP